MIKEQQRAMHGYANAFSEEDILILVSETYPKGFADQNASEKLRSCLKELCGLGVLVRDPQGHYRLRSPNLAPLLDKHDDLKVKLEKLKTREPELAPDPDSYHNLLDDRTGIFSPFTHAQEGRLSGGATATRNFVVALVFASPALGGDRLKAVFQTFARRKDTEGESSRFSRKQLLTAPYTEIKENLLGAGVLQGWLDEFLEPRMEEAHFPELTVWQWLRGDAISMQERVQAALSWCARHDARSRRMRIIFVFDPAAAWTWLQHSACLKLESDVDAVEWPRRWNINGIIQRLGQLGKDSSVVSQTRLLDATAGWPWLMDEFLNQCPKSDQGCQEPVSAFEALKDAEVLAKHQPLPLCDDFRAALGIEENSIAFQVLQKVVELRLSVADITVLPDFMDIPTTGPQCAAAVEFLTRFGFLDREGVTARSPGFLKPEPLATGVVLGEPVS
jgi:hypothetical protein